MSLELDGKSFIVNTTVAGTQRYGDITSLKGGGFASVWADGDNTIRLQRLDAAGAKSGGEIVVNTPADAIIQGRPAVAGLDGGGFVAVWSNYLTGIVAQRFDAAGKEVGGEILINASSGPYRNVPSVTSVEGGGFAVSWESRKSSSDVPNVVSQLVDAGGNKVGTEQAVTSVAGGFGASGSSTAQLAEGYVVAWQDNAAVGVGSAAIKLQRFDEAGTKVGGPVTVDTAANFVASPRVVALEKGFVAVWTASAAEGYAIRAQVYDDAGKAVGGVVTVEAAGTVFVSNPDVTALADGGFAVAWQRRDLDVGDTDLYARSFGADGKADGAAFKVNPVSTGEQTTVRLASGPDGKLVAIWTDQNGGTIDIQAQGFKLENFSGGNQPPKDMIYVGPLTGPAGLRVDEETAPGWGLRVTDPEGETNMSGLKWSIVGGADRNAFTIQEKGLGGGMLTIRQPPDFEAPKDANRDNKYEVVVRVTDSKGASLDKAWTVGVRDLTEVALSEHAAKGTVVLGPQTAVIPGFPSLTKYYLPAGEDRFSIDRDTGAITVNKGFKLDFEQADKIFLPIIRGIANTGTGAPILIKLKDVVNETVTGDDAENRLVGGAGNDTFFGKGGRDELVGGNGRNRLDGGAGDDVLTGGRNDDTFGVDSLKDRVSEQFGGGADTIEASLSYDLAGQARAVLLLGAVENLTLLETKAALNGFGNALANTLRGNGNANILDGGAGADKLYGGRNGDTYHVDDAGDLVFETKGEGSDTVVATVSYILAAGQEIEALKLSGGTGDRAMNLTGNAFAQTLTGNGGANTLDGKGGADTMIGGTGFDSYWVDDARDRVIEAKGQGSDTVLATVSYTLTAGQEIETLRLATDTGKAGFSLTGNEFGNTLVGNAGNNTLNGAGGTDFLTGGDGADTFAFSTRLGADNVDRITLFSHADDTIQLARSAFAGLSAGKLAEGSFATLSSTGQKVEANDRILYDKSNGALYYDANGGDAGGRTLFAILNNKPVIDHTDFFVI